MERLYIVTFKALRPHKCPFYKGGLCTAKGVRVGKECNYTVPYERVLKLRGGKEIISLLRRLGYVRVCSIHKVPPHLSLLPFLIFIMFKDLNSLILSFSLFLTLLAISSSTAERRVVFLGEVDQGVPS